ncbi:thymidylate synthase [Rhizobium rhizogenes]|uniref:thymidylate synthase n=1 Tax=Rhizobium rhizogenes TaxID=359 RepID=UPI0015728F56|nr:thymidylate synthase [Rhizobium rhizogenes]NTF64920.1 thymidylate synthase [Rhizobium rhizogenes]NTG96268.1 thymidylate synthase [Rhizobium rhizogenes]
MFTATADTVDGLLRQVYQQLLSDDGRNRRVESRKGLSTETFAALLELTNPRARVSRSIARSKITSALGEMAWYLSGSDALSFIKHYIDRYDEFSDDNATLNGAYGKRIFGVRKRFKVEDKTRIGTDWQRIMETLKERPGSRNATIQLFANSDARRDSLDIPCTCTLQFIVRSGSVDLEAHMRSNDALLGLPHDVFSFTMFQEIAARELGYEVGRYFHSVGSLHLYDDTDDLPSRQMAQKYLDEHHFDDVPMAAMPHGDPWPSIRQFLAVEDALRLGSLDLEIPGSMEPYWRELAVMLKIYANSKGSNSAAVIRAHIDELSPAFKTFAIDRLEQALGAEQTAMQYLRGN